MQHYHQAQVQLNAVLLHHRSAGWLEAGSNACLTLLAWSLALKAATRLLACQLVSTHRVHHQTSLAGLYVLLHAALICSCQSADTSTDGFLVCS